MQVKLICLQHRGNSKPIPLGIKIMSLHYWNTFLERSRLDRLMDLSLNLMAEQAEEDLDDGDVLRVGCVETSFTLNSLTSIDYVDSSLSRESLMPSLGRA